MVSSCFDVEEAGVALAKNACSVGTSLETKILFLSHLLLRSSSRLTTRV
jgi:hypothetical protein